MAAISPELRAFLSDWLEWAEHGAPEGKPYRRRVGLCNNAPTEDTMHELEEVLIKEFGTSVAPFGDNYSEYTSRATHHLCAPRLAWVRKALSKED